MLVTLTGGSSFTPFSPGRAGRSKGTCRSMDSCGGTEHGAASTRPCRAQGAEPGQARHERRPPNRKATPSTTGKPAGQPGRSRTRLRRGGLHAQNIGGQEGLGVEAWGGTFFQAPCPSSRGGARASRENNTRGARGKGTFNSAVGAKKDADSESGQHMLSKIQAGLYLRMMNSGRQQYILCNTQSTIKDCSTTYYTYCHCYC